MGLKQGYHPKNKKYCKAEIPKEMAEYVEWFVVNGCKYFNGKIIPVALSNP